MYLCIYVIIIYRCHSLVAGRVGGGEEAEGFPGDFGRGGAHAVEVGHPSCLQSLEQHGVDPPIPAPLRVRLDTKQQQQQQQQIC